MKQGTYIKQSARPRLQEPLKQRTYRKSNPTQITNPINTRIACFLLVKSVEG